MDWSRRGELKDNRKGMKVVGSLFCCVTVVKVESWLECLEPKVSLVVWRDTAKQAAKGSDAGAPAPAADRLNSLQMVPPNCTPTNVHMYPV